MKFFIFCLKEIQVFGYKSLKYCLKNLQLKIVLKKLEFNFFLKDFLKKITIFQDTQNRNMEEF